MAAYDPYDAEGGFRLAAPLLERVLSELGDVLVEAHVCRAFHAACAGRARGLPTEVVRSVERLAWARARGCRYSPEALATAAARCGQVGVLLQIERELPNEDATWRAIGALAAVAHQWEVVRLAFARCPDQYEVVLAAATSAGHALVPACRVVRVSDLVPPRAATANEADQAQWLAALSARDRECVMEEHADDPIAAKMLNYTDWPASSVQRSEQAKNGASILTIPRSADVVTNIRPLGDYQVLLRISHIDVRSELSTLLVPAQHLHYFAVYVHLVGAGPPDWGVSYEAIYLPRRGRELLIYATLVDGDSWYNDGNYYGTLDRGFDHLLQYNPPFHDWMRRAQTRG